MTTAPFPTEMTEVDQMLASLSDLAEGTPDPSSDTEDQEPQDGVGSQPPDAEPGEGEGESEGDQTGTALAPPGTIEFEGQYLPIDEVRALLALNDRLKAEPETAQRVSDAIRPQERTNVLPEWIDPEDATAVRLYEEVQSARAETARLQAQNNQSTERDQRARVVDSFRNAVSSFKAKYPGLSDEQIAKVADATGRANIVEGLERSEGSLTAAFDRGMEMTMWSDPNLRSLVAQAQQDKVPSKTDRKSKQSALSGSGGTVPRTREPKVAKTRDELMENMLNAVRTDPDLAGP